METERKLLKIPLGFRSKIPRRGIIDGNLRNVLKNREFKYSLDPSNTFSGDVMDEKGKPIVQGLLAKGGRVSTTRRTRRSRGK